MVVCMPETTEIDRISALSNTIIDPGIELLCDCQAYKLYQAR